MSFDGCLVSDRPLAPHPGCTSDCHVADIVLVTPSGYRSRGLKWHHAPGCIRHSANRPPTDLEEAS